MSLGGLALGVGMLVDNSIVVLESIFRCREEGDTIQDGAERGTREVGGAVIASTLTTICVFLPVAFVEGIAGQMFGDLAMSVTFSLAASLLTALYLVPLLASRGNYAVSSDHYIVWFLRAYKEGRDKKNLGIAGAVIQIPRSTIFFVTSFVKDNWRDVFAPIGGTIHASITSPKKYFIDYTYSAVLADFVNIVFLPFVAGFGNCHLVTLLFLVAVLFFMVFKYFTG